MIRAAELPPEEDHFCFLWILYCRYIACPPSGRPTTGCRHVIKLLATGQQVALGTILLATCYRGLADAVLSPAFESMPGTL